MRLRRDVTPSSERLLMPKSPIFTHQSGDGCRTKMFKEHRSAGWAPYHGKQVQGVEKLTAGFRSLWAKLLLCINVTSSTSCFVISLASSSQIGRSMCFSRSPCSRYSMAMKTGSAGSYQPYDLTKQ